MAVCKAIFQAQTLFRNSKIGRQPVAKLTPNQKYIYNYLLLICFILFSKGLTEKAQHRWFPVATWIEITLVAVHNCITPRGHTNL